MRCKTETTRRNSNPTRVEVDINAHAIGHASRAIAATRDMHCDAVSRRIARARAREHE